MGSNVDGETAARAFGALLLVAALGACGDSSDGDEGAEPDAGAEAPDAPPPWGALTHEHTFEGLSLEGSEESSTLCQSWDLGNEDELWVTRIDQDNGGSWHHSNWFFVDEGTYDGPEGTWPCADRGFSNIAAGAAGGVFFAQSTQASGESQAFGHGKALRIPPRSRIVGQIHLLNTSDSPVEDTALTFSVYTTDADSVEVPLFPASFTNEALSIPPMARSRFHMDCRLSAQRDGLNLYYVLPHFHSLGDYFALSLQGGERDGEVLFESETPIGEPLGMAFDPPLRIDGADAMRMTCGFSSDRDEVVGYGIGDQEMCVVLLYHDADAKFGGIGFGDSTQGEADGDVEQFDASCTAIGL